jgi:hypothetical protein
MLRVAEFVTGSTELRQRCSGTFCKEIFEELDVMASDGSTSYQGKGGRLEIKQEGSEIIVVESSGNNQWFLRTRKL